MKSLILLSFLAFGVQNSVASENKKIEKKNHKKDSSYLGKLRASLQGNNVHIRF